MPGTSDSNETELFSMSNGIKFNSDGVSFVNINDIKIRDSRKGYFDLEFKWEAEFYWDAYGKFS